MTITPDRALLTKLIGELRIMCGDSGHPDADPGACAAWVRLAADEPDETPPVLAVPVIELQALIALYDHHTGNPTTT